MLITIQYEFEAIMWQHPSPGGWSFVSLPQVMAEEIRSLLKSREEAWGRMRAKVKMGNSEWETALWYDTKQHTYLLPIKAQIRKKELFKVNDRIKTKLYL